MYDFFGITDKAVWATLAVPLVLLIVGGLVPYILAILRGARARWGFRFGPLSVEWEVGPNGNELVEDVRRPDETPIVRRQDKGELSVPLEDRPAVR